MDKIPIHIALCLDEKLVEYVGTLIYSISKHHTSHILLVHIVHQGLEEENLIYLAHLEKLFPNVSVRLYQLSDELFSEIIVENYFLPKASYLRLLLPEVLLDVEKVLYLDIDTLICGDLLPLYEADLRGSCIGAVPQVAKVTSVNPYPESIGLSSDRYFNSGVLLLELAVMRERRLVDKMLVTLIDKGSNLSFGDQDILNIVLQDEVCLFSTQYNYTYFCMRDEEDGDNILDAVILHYNTFAKPWHYLVTLSDRILRYHYIYKHYQTEFQNLLLKNRPEMS
ncbi:lipopolysaccharide biosynthesis glycosyltransferase [Streptococcus rupicaprae]|uniref:Lipopolysaccharide biosynthesis glycosyltransferase n=1 Tax=Streptococcus rupicaprae TaxID=759619 RepID=A0ABV2FH95_9STRE